MSHVIRVHHKCPPGSESPCGFYSEFARGNIAEEYPDANNFDDEEEAIEKARELVVKNDGVYCIVYRDYGFDNEEAIIELGNHPKFDDLDDQTRQDLTKWYNQTELTDYDKSILAQLVEDGDFFAHDCGHCGARVFRAEPTDWKDFQGVCNDEGQGLLCAECYGLHRHLAELAED